MLILFLFVLFRAIILLAFSTYSKLISLRAGNSLVHLHACCMKINFPAHTVKHLNKMVGIMQCMCIRVF